MEAPFLKMPWTPPLVVQWLRLRTPGSGVQVQALDRDPHAATQSLHAAAKDPAWLDKDQRSHCN